MKITKKQHEVLKLRAEGFSNKEIAYKLGIDVSAVSDRLRRVVVKCGAKDLMNAIFILTLDGTLTGGNSDD